MSEMEIHYHEVLKAFIRLNKAIVLLSTRLPLNGNVNEILS